MRIGLDETEQLPLVGADVEAPAGDARRRYQQAGQRERITECGQSILRELQVWHPEHRLPGSQHSGAVVRSTGGKVDRVLVGIGKESVERGIVSCRDCGVDPGYELGRGVRLHPAVGLRDRMRRCGRDFRRWLGRHLVEAGERLVLAVGLERLLSNQRAGGVENRKVTNRALETPPPSRQTPD